MLGVVQKTRYRMTDKIEDPKSILIALDGIGLDNGFCHRCCGISSWYGWVARIRLGMLGCYVSPMRQTDAVGLQEQKASR